MLLVDLKRQKQRTRGCVSREVLESSESAAAVYLLLLLVWLVADLLILKQCLKNEQNWASFYFCKNLVTVAKRQNAKSVPFGSRPNTYILV